MHGFLHDLSGLLVSFEERGDDVPSRMRLQTSDAQSPAMSPSVQQQNECRAARHSLVNIVGESDEARLGRVGGANLFQLIVGKPKDFAGLDKYSKTSRFEDSNHFVDERRPVLNLCPGSTSLTLLLKQRTVTHACDESSGVSHIIVRVGVRQTFGGVLERELAIVRDMGLMLVLYRR